VVGALRPLASSSVISASSMDALLAAELESPACPDRTTSCIRNRRKHKRAGSQCSRIYVEASPADSTDGFQSLMSAVGGLFRETATLEVGPTAMDGRWPYIFKDGDCVFA